MSAPHFLAQPPRILFFTGKGGVGKTSVACASAVALAERGRRVLLVSTDPASNLDEVLGTRLSGEPTAVAGIAGLAAQNIDPQAAAHAYRESVVAPLRGILPEAALRSIEEGLSGACTVEIAAFDQFTLLLAEPERTSAYDHVLFDTAPTGHTLRLLKLPRAWDQFLADNTTGTSCIGPLSGLQGKQALYEGSVARLADGAQTALILVSRPDRAALAEAARTSDELAAEGVSNQHLVINGVFRAGASPDPLAQALKARGAAALAALPAALRALPRAEVALSARAPMGLAGLRALFAPAGAPAVAAVELPAETDAPAAAVAPGASSTLHRLLDEFAAGGHGVIMTTGKGGVGKTTLAAAIAVGLATRGHRVHLSTTDPAAHLAAALDDGTGAAFAGELTLSRIDPQAEVAAYTAAVMDSAGAGLDAPGRALLEEDLRSPCTEEIAVFQAFARTVGRGVDGFVVLDTAPTGHTLLLLDAAEAYHREVERKLSELPEDVARLLPRLRDPAFTRVLIVTLPEATPVHEAARLQEDLQRAQIAPYAWVVNQALTPLAPTDSVLRSRRAHEARYIAEVAQLSRRAALVAWQREAPVGAARLLALTNDGGAAADAAVPQGAALAS